jgi:cobalt-zinc-cadmium efflux system membrane fusion protein
MNTIKTICYILGLGMFLTACDSSVPAANNTTNVTVDDTTDIIKPQADLLARLTHAHVVTLDWKTKLKVSGSIELDELRVARVGTTVSGRVTEIKALRGDRVNRGEVLAMVHSSALAEAQLTYLKALAAYQLAQKSVVRAKLLYAEGVIAAAELQRRDSELLSSRAEWEAGKDRMIILGMSVDEIKQLDAKRQIQSVTALRSPIDGVVIDRKVSQGQVLEPADLAYTIAELSQVWVVGEVPERYSAQMRLGKKVQVVIPALADEMRLTDLTYVADTVNPNTRTLRVRALLDNKDGRLKPDMLATLQIDSKAHPKLVIPVQAVFREDNKDKVFVKVADGQYRIQLVQLGEEEDGSRPVESGLSEGQIIVVGGVFQLNADRLIKQQGN